MDGSGVGVGVGVGLDVGVGIDACALVDCGGSESWPLGVLSNSLSEVCTISRTWCPMPKLADSPVLRIPPTVIQRLFFSGEQCIW